MLDFKSNASDLVSLNSHLASLDATARIRWAHSKFPTATVLSSSFGAQSAALLHMMTEIDPATPVVLIDTGYLFAETYRFVEQLTCRLRLNLHVFRAQQSPVDQEREFGQRWLQGAEGIRAYNAQTKVEPMSRALQALNAQMWISGLRRRQSASRAEIPYLDQQAGRYKLYPLADWSDRDFGAYLKRHALPYHPLWSQGFTSIGDYHTTKSLADAGSMEGTRFFGLLRECGLHSPQTTPLAA